VILFYRWYGIWTFVDIFSQTVSKVLRTFLSSTATLGASQRTIACRKKQLGSWLRNSQFLRFLTFEHIFSCLSPSFKTRVDLKIPIKNLQFTLSLNLVEVIVVVIRKRAAVDPFLNNFCNLGSGTILIVSSWIPVYGTSKTIVLVRNCVVVCVFEKPREKRFKCQYLSARTCCQKTLCIGSSTRWDAEDTLIAA